MSALNCKEIIRLGFNPDDFDRMYSVTPDNKLLQYVKGFFRGFISNGVVITEPLFTPSLRIIKEGYICVDLFKQIPNYNTSVLLDTNTGEFLVQNFGAYHLRDDYFAYRVNGHDCDEHRWGVYSLAKHKNICEPTLKYEELYPYLDFLALTE